MQDTIGQMKQTTTSCIKVSSSSKGDYAVYMVGMEVTLQSALCRELLISSNLIELPESMKSV